MLKLLYIAIGGALGSLLRYAVHEWIFRQTGEWSERFFGARFPIGTLIVNATACLAIGLLAGYSTGTQLIREEYRLGLAIGLLGGYSTFSTFGIETFALGNSGNFGLALLNVSLSFGIGLAAVWIGFRLAENYVAAGM